LKYTYKVAELPSNLYQWVLKKLFIDVDRESGEVFWLLTIGHLSLAIFE